MTPIPGVLRRVRRHVHPRVRRLRCHPPQGSPGWAGLVIGFVVFAAIIPVAPTTGASINPARTTGPMIVQQILGGEVHWDQYWVYIVAELLGGVARRPLLFGLISRTAGRQDSLEEKRRQRHEEADQRTGGGARRRPRRRRGGSSRAAGGPRQPHHLPRHSDEDRARSRSSRAAARATSRCTADSSASGCSTRPAPVRSSPRRRPTRCRRRRRSSTPAPACCTS